MKYIYALLFYCIPFISLQAQTLYKIQNDKGLYGYIDKSTDKLVVPCKYIHAYTDTIKSIGFAFDAKTKKIVCFNSKGTFLFNVFRLDNGPDYIKEGLFRIINEENLIGFADSLGNVVIPPVFKFAYPFSHGKAKVTFTGKSNNVKGDGYHYFWDSNSWFYISRP